MFQFVTFNVAVDAETMHQINVRCGVKCVNALFIFKLSSEMDMFCMQ
jgi:hypothetical protein